MFMICTTAYSSLLVLKLAQRGTEIVMCHSIKPTEQRNTYHD